MLDSAKRRYAELGIRGALPAPSDATPTEMFPAAAYDERVVGYLKVDVYSAPVARNLPRQLSREAQTSYYYIEILSDGKLGKKFDDHGPASTDILLPSSYIFSTITDNGIKKSDDVLTSEIPEFVEKFGFTFILDDIKKTLDEIRAAISGKTSLPPSIENYAAAATPNIPSDNTSRIFKSLGDPADIAFFLVEIANANIYVCKKVDGKYIVDWNSAISVPVPVPATWSTVWSYIPFCTVTDLAGEVKDTDITFYPRTNLHFIEGEEAVTDLKKIPPPFNLANRSTYGVATTFKDRLNDAKKKLQTVAAKAKYDMLRTKNDDVVAERTAARGLSDNKDFLQRLNAVGCMDGADNLLGPDMCGKIKTIIGKTTAPEFQKRAGGGRSKRNKHRRNKRTVSHRGRGHKRSRRVDGGSRKCGKKCRRKHTRK